MINCCSCNAFVLDVGCTIPSTDMEWACPNYYGDDDKEARNEP